MDDDAAPHHPNNDPASAFEALRGEVSLLRRAVEGLTAERQNAPDYTPTLTELADRLACAEAFLGTIAESPAMRLTPENLATSIAKASEIARADDRTIIRQAHDMMHASLSRIDGMVEQAWTARRQMKQICWTAGGGVCVGASGILSAWYLIG
jgi:hypothetical protein